MKLLLDRRTGTREEWLALKANRIGSSQVSTILGINPWQTPYQLWAEMTGKAPGLEDNDVLWLGRAMEPIVGELFSRRTGFRIEASDVLCAHDEYDFACASPDFYYWDGEAKGILETKNTNFRMQSAWESGAPVYYATQLNWQLGVMGIPFGTVAALIGGAASEFTYETMEFNAELFNVGIEECERFLEYVKKDIPPPATGDDWKLLSALRNGVDDIVKLDGEEHLTRVHNYKNLKKANSELNAMVKENKARMDSLQAEMVQAMGDRNIGIFSNGDVIKLTKVETKERIQAPYSYTLVNVKEYKI